MKRLKRTLFDAVSTFWTCAASICLICEAVFQFSLRCRLGLVIEACNMGLILILIVFAWLLFLFKRHTAARYCYALYAWELIIDTIIMGLFHTHFYSPSHCLLQCGLACLLLALCKERGKNDNHTR